MPFLPETFQFASPWCLLALLVLPAIHLLRYARRRRHRAAMPFSSLRIAQASRRSWRVRLRWLPEVVADVAFAALCLALARPQSIVTTAHTEQSGEGIAIEMVLDRSGSMSQPMAFEYQQTTRLEAVKRIFSLFLFGDDTSSRFAGRDGDLVGLVTFAKTAETNCPLTLGHDALADVLQTIVLIDPADTDAVKNAAQNGVDLNAALLMTRDTRALYNAFGAVYGRENAEQAVRYFAEIGENNRTAIGDALALGLARLRQADAKTKDYTIKSKVLILLTDGENNAGREISSVIGYAKDSNVKVHVIAIGEARQQADPALAKIAEETGGKYLLADTADEILQIYQDIDKMERSKLTDITYTNSVEMFQPFLLTAFILILLHILLSHTIFRTLP